MTVSELLNAIDWPPPGHYVVAVSGGVDSVVLLHLLAERNDGRWQLRIAHFDHGIRPDSSADRRLVEDLARIYQLPFHTDRGDLGEGTSEEAARSARYDFLHRVRTGTGAGGIITAHHQSDRLETSLLNLLRGSGAHGAAPLKSVDGIYRPLVKVPKPRLVSYAKAQGLPWREDSTNSDLTNPRNFIRHELLPYAERARPSFKGRYRDALTELDAVNTAIDRYLEKWIKDHGSMTKNRVELPKAETARLEPEALRYLVNFLMRHFNCQLARADVSRLAHFLKTARSGQEKHLPAQLKVKASYDTFTLTHTEG